MVYFVHEKKLDVWSSSSLLYQFLQLTSTHSDCNDDDDDEEDDGDESGAVFGDQ
jgi:hypothetical protein